MLTVAVVVIVPSSSKGNWTAVATDELLPSATLSTVRYACV